MVAPRLDAPATEESPRPDTAWWGLHAARYVFAAQRLRARHLLDVACGTGYGLTLLSGVADVAVGVELESSALLEARQAGPVVQADGTVLPFPDSAFDAVTTFETIEHLENRAGFLAELARVLAPDGDLVLSTPNALHTRPVDGKPRNPYHIFEYKPEELLAEVSAHFEDVVLLGQRLSSRFVMSPFWDDQERMEPTPRNRARLLVWRLLNKLPAGPRDLLSERIWGHQLYPNEHDYTFAAEGVEDAPVLVVCAKPRRAA